MMEKAIASGHQPPVATTHARKHIARMVAKPIAWR